MRQPLVGIVKDLAMKHILTLCAIFEAVTGLALIVAPSLAGTALLGEPLTGGAIPLVRVAGIALIGLAIACRPGPAHLGMLVYGALVMLYLAFLGLTGIANGWLLWPAVVGHLLLTMLLVAELPRALGKTRR
jgi:hypothetical protein